MGLQISCGFHTEVSEESGVRENQEEPWRRVPRLGPAVGRDEETIRAYIKDQEFQDRQMDQLALIPVPSQK